MVFEAVVVELLNKFLSHYVENLDTSQLKIGIWGGNVLLRDLKIKSTVFDDLNLPIRVTWGKLGRLSLKIPWKNLYSAPAVVEIEELLLIAVPFTEFVFDPIKEEKWAQDSKQAKLKAIEEAKKKDLGDDPEKKDGFVEKLLTQIIKNLQIVIKNIHIRYEDRSTIPNSPFSVGVTLSVLSCESSDNDPSINYSKFMDGQNFICKRVDLNGLSIYWNSNSMLFSNLPTPDLISSMIENIPTNDYKPKALMYMFGPLSATAFLRLNPKPENDGSNFTIPKIFVNVHLKEIELGITSSQFCDVLSYIEEFERFLAGAKFRKYRPVGIPLIGHAKEWWRFACTAVLECIIRRKREWSWSHIKEHREICKEYSRLFNLKLTSKKMSPEEEEKLKALEKKLNVFNLVLLREQVYVQVERTVKETKPTGWFSSWFRSGNESKMSDSEDELVKKIQSVMTSHEKEKLYKAIGYEESGSPASYPIEFVGLQFWFHLDEMKATVYDSRMKLVEPIMTLSVRSIKMEFEQRPSASAMKFVFIIGKFHVIGKPEADGSHPELVTSTCQESESLIELLYETKPLNSSCDVRIIVNAQPLRIIFHAETVNVVRDIFSHSSSEVDKIVAATSASLPAFREITAFGLQYAIEKRTELEVQVNIMSSYLIIPYGGVYRPEKEMLVILLGSLEIETERSTTRKVDVRKMFLEGTTDEEIFSTVLSASYTNFRCRLTGIQVLFQLSGEDWVSASQMTKSNLQFLEPTNLEVTIKKSLVMDDARIPKIIIEAQVPSLALNFSEERFLGLVALASSISVRREKQQTMAKKGVYASSWSIHSLNAQLENTLITVEKNFSRRISQFNYVQGINLVGNFEISELIVNVIKTRSTKSEKVEGKSPALEKEFLNLHLFNLGLDFTQKTFEVVSYLKLGGIRFYQYINKDWLELVSPKGEETEYLFIAEYINHDTRIPDFYTTKNAIVNRLTLTMTPLNVVLDNTCMLAILKFVTNVQRKVERVKETFLSDHMADSGKEVETIYEESRDNLQADKKVITKGKRFRRKAAQKDVIDFFLQANMDELNVFVQLNGSGLAKFNLKDASIEISSRKSYLTLDVKIKDILLQDLHPRTKHPRIVRSLEDNTLSSRITIYDKEYFGSENTLDMSIEAEVGGIECTFVTIFCTRAIKFLNGFQRQVDSLKQGATVAAQRAKENVVKAFNNAAEICVKIKMTAPFLLIPRSSVSMEALVIDLGVLTIKNSIAELDCGLEEGATSKPLIDILKVHLKNLKVGRRKLSSAAGGAVTEKMFLLPVSTDLTLKRNLSMNWFRAIPDLEIVARLLTIQITLTHEDLVAILSIVRENLKEEEVGTWTKKHLLPPEYLANSPSKMKKGHALIEAEHAAKPTADKENTKPSGSYTRIKFLFFMDSFIFDTKTTTPGKEDQEVGLGRFLLQAMSVKGRLFSDGAISTAIKFGHCIAEDTRPGEESRLTRLLGKKNDTDLVDGVGKENNESHMLQIIYETKGEDSFVDIKVYQFRLIISMDYLKKLLDFFSVEDKNAVEDLKATAKPEIRRSSFVEEPLTRYPTFTVNIRLEKPDIIFVENMNSFNVDALVFRTEMIMKYRIAGGKQLITGTLSDIELYDCCFKPPESLQTLNQVIKPFTVSVAGSTPEGSGLHVDVCVTDVFIVINPGTVTLISKCYEALMKDSCITKKALSEKDYSDLWDIKKFSDSDYSFLQAEMGIDVLSNYSNRSSLSTSSINSYNEICLLAVPTISIYVEGVEKSRAEPLILLQMGFSASCYNWSDNLYLTSSLSLEMKYFNKKIFNWEPFFEPTEKYSDHGLHRSLVPWELNCSVTYGEGEFEELRPPNVQITLSSTEMLPVTLTKTGIDVLKYTVDKYTTAVTKHVVSKIPGPGLPPYVIKNETGFSLELLLEESNFRVCTGATEEYKVVRLDSNSEVELRSVAGSSVEIHGMKLEGHLIGIRKTPVFIRFPDLQETVFELSIEKPFKRYFPFKTNSGASWVFVVDVSRVNNSTVVVIKSICTVNNYFNKPINIHTFSENDATAKYVGTVEGNSTFTLPLNAIYNGGQKLFFSVNGYSLSIEPFDWNNKESGVSCLLQCTSKTPENEDPFFIQADVESNRVYYGNTNYYTKMSVIFNIHLQPTVKMCNSLMFPLVFCFQGSAKEETLQPGNNMQVSNAEPGTTTVTLRIEDYLDKKWSCKETILENPSEFLIWQFSSFNGISTETLNLGVQVTQKRKTAVYTIYCPYLMINKTGHLLSYRFEDNRTVFYHPGHMTLPIMFSPNNKKFFGKKMASLKVGKSSWSDMFPIDVAGSGGTIDCKEVDSDKVYKISVTITLSQNNMSRMIVFTPFYVFINSTEYSIEYQECKSPDKPWLEIPSHCCQPFWPDSQDPKNTIRLRPKGSKEVTPEFLYDSTEVYLLRLPNKYGGINVDIKANHSGTYMTFVSYEPGQTPVLLINYSNVTLTIKELDTEFSMVLKPHEQVMHTWLCPAGKRKLAVQDSCSSLIELEINEDGGDNVSENVKYVSFLDGKQRIVLFTQDERLSVSLSNLRLSTSGIEIVAKIQGIGVSLINDITRVEILYMAIFSSGISWESKQKGKRRFKVMNKDVTLEFENAYQKFLETNSREKLIPMAVGQQLVDFENMVLVKPLAKELKRTFEPGLWMTYRFVEDYVMLHLKVHKVQIDSQLMDCVFPVVLAAVPPPKTVASISQDPKPLFELSIVKIRTNKTGVWQYKYFKTLVQEFHVKVDIGLIHTLWEFLTPLEISEEEEKSNFKKDLSFVERPLEEFVEVATSEEQKNFFDWLHFSPLKIHFSFSLGGKVGDDGKNYLPPSIRVMLQSVGVTLADVNDVIFRLSCLERKNCFLTNRELIKELKTHYNGQIVRQAYVLVLGLDVIGNPFGLLVGIGKGVEAFFYEPFQGMIRGPAEFGKGVAIGWKSLFGHTVGSAAGTLGKLADSLGKGLAVLSLDEEYQMQRMTNQSKHSSVQTQMARGGRGLLMGVVDGVTGIVQKPIKGAYKKGLGGFVKGVGQGMMGLITRPVTGIVDFASTSFYAVNRATMAGAKNERLRPPRYFRENSIIEPYNLREAEGNLIFYELERQRYVSSDKYEYHLLLKPKEIALLTNKRIIFAEYSDVFGTWQEHMSIMWESMSDLPRRHSKGIALSIRKKDKPETKIVVIEEQTLREEIFQKMSELYFLAKERPEDV